MKNFLPLILALLLLQTSCNKETTSVSQTTTLPNDSTKISEKFEIDSVKMEDSLKIDANLTADFASTVLVFPQISDKVLLDSIYAKEQIKLAAYSKTDLLEDLKSKKENFYEETKNSLKDWKPDFKQTWTAHSDMDVHSHENDLLTLVYTGEGFTGGAHGYYYEFYKVFDLKNKKTIQLTDVILDVKATIWSKILMDNFLKNDLQNGQAQMLLVKDIPLNDNFYFDKENLYFLYNQYEIAAYAAGPILIKVPFATIKPLMKTDIKTRLGL